MAHGLVKLERLFAGSKRRGRARQKPIPDQQKMVITAPRQPSSPVFPPPSFLKPTSTIMMPRDVQDDCSEDDQDHSRSLPSLQEALHGRSSATSSITIVDHQPGQPDTLAPSLPRSSRTSQTEPHSSYPRLKEDKPFRDEQMVRSSGVFHRKVVSRELPTRVGDIQSSEKGLLDWTPKHISFHFDPLEFNMSSKERSWGSRSNSTGSTLLPSPDFAPLTPLLDGCELANGPDRSAFAHPQLVQRNSVRTSTISLRRQSLLPHSEPLLESAPASKRNSGDLKSTIHRTTSLSSLVLPRPKNATWLTSTGPSSTSLNRNFSGRRTGRETWGKRLEDPQLTASFKSSNNAILQPGVRKYASTSTLSDLTLQISQDHILKEPTFDDFYALSDDDIAESQPSYNARSPATPFSKDNKALPDYHGESRQPQSLTSRYTTLRSAQDATLTCSPIDAQLLSLTFSPASRRNADGALRAAELARKYNFAVVYVLSLWPVDSKHRLNVTTNAPAGLSQPTGTTMTERFAVSARASHMSGRFLAAYGLKEVPSPFEVVTESHLAALNCDHWNEYRNFDACPNDISRGWICSFYTDYIPTSAPSMITRNTTEEPPKNRGIVFAAYSKQVLNPAINMRVSPRQHLLLRQLFSDAKALVEALVLES
ncbi:hypothetical protein F4861DRAFT_15083 [Xylaria intraflava]|nr:hypothetical protein F4861DRAFT_15083 [Xylaria intraflava]